MRAPLTAGSQLGRYHIQRKLGRGGSGVAYLAQDTTLDTPIVVKVLNEAITRQVEGFARFKREVLLARRIAHPGICRVFDIHCEDDIWFMTMEFVEGETLEALLQDRGALAIPRAIRIMREICRALAAAEDAGVIHRDLKPKNIMVRAADAVSILDFGLATAVDVERLTRTGRWMGTPHYMAPEVARGEPASRASDIYSVGAILYRTAAGRVPFSGLSLLEIRDAVLEGRLVPPHQYNPDIAPELEGIILTAMAPNPDNRHDSASKLELELAGVERIERHEQLTPWDGDIESSVQDLIAKKETTKIFEMHRRQATLLFSDIVGITQYFDKHGDIEGRKRIKKHNDLLFPMIRDNGGRVIKTIGDAIMAFFADPDHAVLAAIDMQRALGSHNAARRSPGDSIKIRIGVNTGSAIVESDDIFGDTVNVAARVSSLAQGDQILISKSTHAGLKQTLDRASFSQRSVLKGKTGEFELFAVRWETDPEAIGGMALFDTPLDETPEVDAWSVTLDETTDSKTKTKTLIPATDTQDTDRVTPLEESTPNLEATVVGEAVGDRRVDSEVHLANLLRRIFDSRIGIVAVAIIVLGLFVLVRAVVNTDVAIPEPSPVVSATDVSAADKSAPEASSPEPSPSEFSHVPLPPLELLERSPPSAETGTADSTRSTKTVTVRAQLSDLRRQLDSAAKQRALLRGDAPALDRELDNLSAAIRNSRLKPGREAAKRARHAINNVVIDEKFVLKKLDRFNRRYDRIKDKKRIKAVAARTPAVLEAIDQGKFKRANVQLTKAFALFE